MYVDCNQNDPEQNMCILLWVPLICSPSRSWFWPQTKVNQTSIDPAKTGNIFWCFCYARKLLMLPAPSWQPGRGSKFERPRWTRKWGILNVFFCFGWSLKWFSRGFWNWFGILYWSFRGVLQLTVSLWDDLGCVQYMCNVCHTGFRCPNNITYTECICIYIIIYII